MKESKAGKVPEMGSLADPLNNRQIKEVPPPAHAPLSGALLYGAGIKQLVTYREEAKLEKSLAPFSKGRKTSERAHS